MREGPDLRAFLLNKEWKLGTPSSKGEARGPRHLLGRWYLEKLRKGP